MTEDDVTDIVNEGVLMIKAPSWDVEFLVVVIGVFLYSHMLIVERQTMQGQMQAEPSGFDTVLTTLNGHCRM